ncbi:MAG: type II secretion system F family protein, partial [Balneolales bacterium]
MSTFKFKGLSNQGKLAQGEFEATNKKTARARIDKLAKTKGIKIQSLEQKFLYTYKVKKNGKLLSGEQEAYNK